MVAAPARHPLLAFKKVPLEEVLRYPLTLGDPAACEGHARQVDRFLRKLDQEPLIAQRVATFYVIMTSWFPLVWPWDWRARRRSASSLEPGVVARRLAGTPPHAHLPILLRSHVEPSEVLARFIERVAFY